MPARDDDKQINVARTLANSQANGPGTRFVIWVQGCPLACPGCWNPDTWDTAPRNVLTPRQLMHDIRTHRADIEGVTVSGGEPMAQAAALVPLAQMIREEGLTLMVYSGLTRDEMVSPAHTDLLALTDILIAGRYHEQERDLTPRWRGSRNQTIHFLSSAYAEADMTSQADVELVFDDDGGVTVTGFPDDDLLDILSHN